MRSQVWNSILGVAAVACLVGEAIAQTSGPLAGLDELLGKQKNLTIFRSYLKVGIHWWRIYCREETEANTPRRNILKF